MRSEDADRRVITIPALASVTLVAGDICGKGVVTVDYHDQPMKMLAVDLRTHAVLDPSV
jgi:hypothetical protein